MLFTWEAPQTFPAAAGIPNAGATPTTAEKAPLLTQLPSLSVPRVDFSAQKCHDCCHPVSGSPCTAALGCPGGALGFVPRGNLSSCAAAAVPSAPPGHPGSLPQAGVPFPALAAAFDRGGAAGRGDVRGPAPVTR